MTLIFTNINSTLSFAYINKLTKHSTLMKKNLLKQFLIAYSSNHIPMVQYSTEYSSTDIRLTQYSYEYSLTDMWFAQYSYENSSAHIRLGQFAPA